MKGRAEDWIMVRLPRKLHVQLWELAELWSRAYARGVRTPEPDDEGRIALHRVIQTLLERDAKHRLRSRKKVLKQNPPGR